MTGLDRYRSEDRRALELLYRRSAGAEAAERLKLTWQWERRQNPAGRGASPPWVVREGTSIVAALPTRPVDLSLRGQAVRGLWLAALRISRCHPWGGSGYDPVPQASCHHPVASLVTESPRHTAGTEGASWPPSRATH